MKVLVTGATGGLGRNLCAVLADHGHQGFGTGRNLGVGAQLTKNGVQFTVADIRRKSSLSQLPKDIDVVIHCAALSSPWGPYQEFYDTNVVGTANVLEWAGKAGVRRFLHVSTPAVYCNGDNRYSLTESAPLPARFVNHYARTKYLAEQAVDEAGRRGLPVVTIRPRGIFGPHDTALMPRLLGMVGRGWFPMIDGGVASLDVTYVQNVVDALLQLIVADDSVIRRKYNITNDEPLSIRELMTKVMNALSLEARFVSVPYHRIKGLACVMDMVWKPPLFRGEPKLTKYGVILLGKTLTLNIDAAKRDFGYRPRISLDEGLLRYAHWLRVQKQEVQ